MFLRMSRSFESVLTVEIDEFRAIVNQIMQIDIIKNPPLIGIEANPW
jgi:hypothetical protein